MPVLKLSRCSQLGNNEPAPVPGMKWIVSWTIVPETTAETATSKEKSFDEILLDCMKSSQEKPVIKIKKKMIR